MSVVLIISSMSLCIIKMWYRNSLVLCLNEVNSVVFVRQLVA